jgi:hypothetical protein
MVQPIRVSCGGKKVEVCIVVYLKGAPALKVFNFSIQIVIYQAPPLTLTAHGFDEFHEV